LRGECVGESCGLGEAGSLARCDANSVRAAAGERDFVDKRVMRVTR